MNRPKISISIDGPLLERIDRVAERRGEARSEVIERMVRNAIAEEEACVGAMENPVVGAVMQYLAESPKLLRAVAVAVGEQLSDEDVKRIQQGASKIRGVRERARGQKAGA